MLKQLEALRDVLLGVTQHVYHFDAAVPQNMRKAGGYIVWAENSEADSVEADNRKVNQAVNVTVSYCTKNGEDLMVDAIQKAFAVECIAFSFQFADYDPDTDVITYEWEAVV